MKYTIRNRVNTKGKPCIAPFIDESNVWDIPVKEYSATMEQAIKQAYLLGVRHTVDKIINIQNNLVRFETFE